MEIDTEKLDALIKKAQELERLLKESPEIIAYLRLMKEIDAEKLNPPKIDDVLLRRGEAAKILGVSQGAISRYAKEGKLKRYLVAGSSHWRYWRSEVKALAQEVKGNGV